VIESVNADRAMYGLAIAIQAIVWGAGQPIAGAIADRFGAARVLAFGAVFYSAAMLLMGASTTALAIHATAGFMVGVGMAALSLTVVLASVSRLAPPEKVSRALGIATAFSTAGQVVLIPVAQWLVDQYSWRTAVVVLGGLLAVMVFFAPVFRGNAADQTREGATVVANPLSYDLRRARHSRGYQLLNLAFFVCGFHVTFIATHLKSYAVDLGQAGSIAAWALVLIGLFNMAGSYGIGVLGETHSATHMLSVVYGLRAVVIAIFILAPASGTATLLFGAAIGLLWLTTVPPTSAIIAQQFGTANAGALFGIVFFSHQVGAFIGAWLGGWLADTTGSYLVAWWIAIGLAIFAAVIHLFVDEGPAPAPPENPGRPSRIAQAAAVLALVVGLSGLGAIAAPVAEASGGDTPAFYCSLHILATN
ncbi:MAG: MFS transporter, partial [Acidimicrobiales bacterium]